MNPNSRLTLENACLEVHGSCFWLEAKFASSDLVRCESSNFHTSKKKTCTFWPRYKRLAGRSYGKRPSSWHGKWHLKIVLFMDLTSVAPANASWRTFRCKWRTPSCTLCTGAWRSMRSVMAWHLQRLQTANVEKNSREMPSSLEIWHTHTSTILVAGTRRRVSAG